MWSTGVTLKKPNVLFCLSCSGQEGGISGLSNFKWERWHHVIVPTYCWNCADSFLNALSSVEKSGSGFRVPGSTGGHWMSIKPTREAVMSRAGWRVWTHRLTQLDLLFFCLFFSNHVHTCLLKNDPFLLHTECSLSKRVRQHHLARLFSQLRHSTINSVNLTTVTCSQVADGDSPVACFL